MCEPLENKVSAQDLDHEICIHCHFDWVIIWSNGVGPISKSVTYFSRCLAGNQISISLPFVRTIKTEPTRWVQTQLWRSSSIRFNRRSAEEIDLFFCASASIFIQLCSHLMEKLTLNHIFILLMEKHSCLRFFNQLFFSSWQFSSVPPLLCYGFHVDVVLFSCRHVLPHHPTGVSQTITCSRRRDTLPGEEIYRVYISVAVISCWLGTASRRWAQRRVSDENI